jgi:hypothetical protein
MLCIDRIRTSDSRRVSQPAPTPGFVPPEPAELQSSHNRDSTTTTTSDATTTTARPHRSSMRHSAPVPDPAPTPGFQVPPPNVPPTSRVQTQQNTTVQQEPTFDSVLEPLPPANPSVFGPPGPRPRTPLRNPLPPPPQDLYETSPYRSLLRDLPRNADLLSRSNSTSAVSLNPDRGGFFGRKKSKRGGLFHSLSTGGSSRRPHEPINFPGGYYSGQPVNPVEPVDPVSNEDVTASAPVFVPPPPPVPQPSTSTSVPTTSVLTQPQTSVPPVRFNNTGSLAGFLNHAPYRVLYNNQTYPTATHLYEALKFIGHRHDLAEKIRKVKAVHEVYPLSSSFQKHARRDWGSVFLQTVCHFAPFRCFILRG